MTLTDAMNRLEVSVEFDPFVSGNTTQRIWSDNIKLFIIHGTYLEFLRGKRII